MVLDAAELQAEMLDVEMDRCLKHIYWHSCSCSLPGCSFLQSLLHWDGKSSVYAVGSSKHVQQMAVASLLVHPSLGSEMKAQHLLSS